MPLHLKSEDDRTIKKKINPQDFTIPDSDTGESDSVPFACAVSSLSTKAFAGMI